MSRAAGVLDLIRIGTRGSALALAQARSVSRALELGTDGAVKVQLVPITTSGDRPRSEAGDKSRFVKEIEEALLREEVDLAVHSAKDVPGMLPDGLAIVGAPSPQDPRDAIVGGAGSIDELPAGARVGTSSVRRRSQLLALRPDLDVFDLRGNVDTRLRKLDEDGYEAVVLALAGLRRLGREAQATAVLDADVFVPAPGQGVLALEARSDDSDVAAAVTPLCDENALERLTAERALVAVLEASCHTPVGALAGTEDGVARIAAYVGLPDGSEWIRDEVAGPPGDPAALGRSLAERLLAAGAGDFLRRAASG